MSLYGKARITWNDGQARQFDLQMPLQKQTPGFRQRVFAVDSADYTQREVITVGTGVYELAARLRYETAPWTLLGMIKAGIQGYVLRYIPDTDVPGTYNDCLLIEPATLADLDREADWPYILEYGIGLRLRRTDGGVFV